MIEIREVKGRRELRSFIAFADRLYAASPCYVPPMLDWELSRLDLAENPAGPFCQAIYFMAWREGHPVGRIAGFINHRSNQKFGIRQCRFGCIDFIDDKAVSRALLDAVAAWGRAEGLEQLAGPFGISELDPEGCLVEGFDLMPTSATIYNFPYYADHLRAYGLQPEAEWTEHRFYVREGLSVPEKHRRVSEAVRRRLGLHVVESRHISTLARHYGQAVFRLLNQAYAPLYGFCELTQGQIDYYLKHYLGQLRGSMVRLVVNANDELVAFGVVCPSLSVAQRRARGRWLPFGWWHMLRAMYLPKGTDTLDLLLIAVRPDMQSLGINALIFAEFIPEILRGGYTWVESNPELTTNMRVQSQWSYFNEVATRKRMAFSIKL